MTTDTDHPETPEVPTFERTTCACPSCVRCCKEQPGPLAPGQIATIAAYLQKPVRDVLTLFWASPGALVKSLATGKRWMIGTITPRMRNGRCVFLDADDRCRIHPVAPFGCSHYDTHMPEAEWTRRGMWLYRAIEDDPEYQSIRATLAPATSWRPR